MTPTAPLAVSPTVKTPGFYLNINLLGGAAAPGNGALRVLIISPKNTSDGNITPGTEIRQVFGADDVATSHGQGNQAHLCAKRLFQHYKLASVDVAAAAESAGAAAAATTTFTGPVTENSVVRFRIHGRVIDVPWNSGEAATAFVARAVLTLSGFNKDLFVTVADGGTGSITYTAKSKGPWGNDVLVNASFSVGGTGGAVSVSPAALTGGTTEPTIATVLSNVDTKQYRRIILCISNADATLTTSSSNAERLRDHIQLLDQGNSAKLQIGCVGFTGTTTNAKGGAVDRNAEAFQYVLGRDFEDLPCELAGAEVGDTLAAISIRANRNRIRNKLKLYGPRVISDSRLTEAEVEDLLNNGVTPLDFEEGTGEIFVVRPITTHSLDGANPDYRCLDMTDVDGVYTVADDLRTAVVQEFRNCSISPDQPPNSDPLPEGVVELKDVRAFYLSRLELWAARGVVNRTELRATVAADGFGFSINASDPTQVDTFLPFSIVKPLAKIGTVIQKTA